jgi:hypothetical protein
MMNSRGIPCSILWMIYRIMRDLSTAPVIGRLGLIPACHSL